MVSAIVAIDDNWGIGYKGNLLASIPGDLKHFKELTTGNPVVMGRKTWDSLPKKPLPGRWNIVITNNQQHNQEASFWSLYYIKLYMLLHQDYDYFIIGGSAIYSQLLSFCDYIYITKIYKSFENVDTYFPNLDKDPSWEGCAVSEKLRYKDLLYQFWEYKRKN